MHRPQTHSIFALLFSPNLGCLYETMQRSDRQTVRSFVMDARLGPRNSYTQLALLDEGVMRQGNLRRHTLSLQSSSIPNNNKWPE